MLSLDGEPSPWWLRTCEPRAPCGSSRGVSGSHRGLLMPSGQLHRTALAGRSPKSGVCLYSGVPTSFSSHSQKFRLIWNLTQMEQNPKI